MAVSISELLLPQVVLEVISRLKKGRGPLASWLGFQPTAFDPETVTLNGPNTLQGTGSVRNVTYRVFDHTRVPMKARAPGTGPATVAENPMGQNTVSVARFHQKIPLNYEFLGNLSPMIGPNSQVDAGGQNYIMQQTTFLGEQANNAVEFLAAGMMRDSCYFVQVGDDWFPSFTAAVAPNFGFQVNFQIPSGNKLKGNFLGTGDTVTVSWANVGAPIIGNIETIKMAYAQLSRYPLTDVWVNSGMWYNVITNTEVRNLAGSADRPFAEWDQLPDRGMGESGPSNKYFGVLRGEPTINWHFCDDTLAFLGDVDPSYATQPTGSVTSTTALSKLIPDNMAIFATEPSPDWTKLYHGGEYVVENPGQVGTLRQGYYFWHEYVTQPAVIELISLLNCIPLLYIPAVLAPLTVVF